MLGHSSINVTEIYTHVTVAKQKNILTTKHPERIFKSNFLRAILLMLWIALSLSIIYR